MSAMDPVLVLTLTVLFIALSAFFVVVQFSLVAVRRHRLEEAARDGVAARVALRGMRRVSLLISGTRFGITLATLALGSVSKPAVHHTLEPLMEGALPPAVATTVSFTLALLIISFLHLVVGEMAPRSWALGNAERAVIVTALPMRMFMVPFRPLLVVFNGAADRCLRLVGVDPLEALPSGRGPEAVRELVEHSAAADTLDAERRDRITTALEVQARPLGEALTPSEEIAQVPLDAGLERIIAVGRRTGHLRLVITDHGEPVGELHVREALTASPGTRAADLMRPLLSLPTHTPMSAALSVMREGRSHLCLVRDGKGALMGPVTLEDLLDRLLPERATT
ncbi:MAG TPA: hemolysin family protein [Nocardiopsis listeri]|uniref:hemolysin family protein n=1 Tax=Nocardiopsis listeri TaxID=53440 RepID=UPI001D8F4986|nr:hemolysin family protein [Nocardiopsis listeri]HJE58520.1 hemolysin family protein [Nocardiopsis listeri]